MGTVHDSSRVPGRRIASLDETCPTGLAKSGPTAATGRKHRAGAARLKTSHPPAHDSQSGSVAVAAVFGRSDRGSGFADTESKVETELVGSLCKEEPAGECPQVTG